MIQSRSIIAAVCTVGVASFSAFAVPLPSANVPATTTVPELRAFALTGPPAPTPAPASTVLVTGSGPIPSAENSGLNTPEIDILIDDKPLLDVAHRHLQPHGQENIELSKEEHHHHEKADVEQQSHQHFYGGNEEFEVEPKEYRGGHGSDEASDVFEINVEELLHYRSGTQYSPNSGPLFASPVHYSEAKAEREDDTVFMRKSADDPLPPHLLPRGEPLATIQEEDEEPEGAGTTTKPATGAATPTGTALRATGLAAPKATEPALRFTNKLAGTRTSDRYSGLSVLEREGAFAGVHSAHAPVKTPSRTWFDQSWR
ncbi:hypothetical protein C8R42DRAFT_157358 [Lentinula raphanica]|nr:hypothetical protein C8R42DRAFT_157358 [Lentinula raphanica]